MKFCGCQSWADVQLALECGADAAGLIFAPSPRRIEWEAAADVAARLGDAPIDVVAVVVDPSAAELQDVHRLFPRARVQFSGTEPLETVSAYGAGAIKAIHLDEAVDPLDLDGACKLFAEALILFDSKGERTAGGSGRVFPWAMVGEISAARPVVIAGGLTPENAGDCVRELRPFGVDVRSGIESDGRKDEQKMRAFVRAVRHADEA